MTSRDESSSKSDDPLTRATATLSTFQSRRQREPLQVTVGAGVAIAGAWLAGSAVTITILLIMFVLNPIPEDQQAKIDGWSVVVLFFLIASPMIAAYSITKVILSKD